MKQEYLNEEKYARVSKTLFLIGIIMILLGIVITILKVIPTNNDGNNEKLQQQLNKLEPSLKTRYNQLKNNGFEESMDYKDKEGYEMFLIDTALDPTYDTCESSTRYSDNDTTREYCKVKAKLYNLNSDKPTLITPIIMPILAGIMLIVTAKRREIIAFQTQQVMPVAQEGMEKMAPTMGNVAKEISKGIKEGLKEDSENEEK